MLLDGRNMVLRVPLEKRSKAVKMLQNFCSRKKATVRELQELCGFFNFLCRAIFPGRVFTRRMYAKYSEKVKLPIANGTISNGKVQNEAARLKPSHHVRLDKEFKNDCKVWLRFLDDNTKLGQIIKRPKIDVLGPFTNATEICFFSDASAAKNLGYGCIYGNKWIRDTWNADLSH